MGLFSFLSQLGKNAGNVNDKNSSWEEHCESCGELLEDCECDWKRISREDTSNSWPSRDENEIDLWDE